MINFVSIYKSGKQVLSKTQRKTPKRSAWYKKQKKARERNQNITEEEENRHEYNQEHKQKLPEYRINYYLIY